MMTSRLSPALKKTADAAVDGCSVMYLGLDDFPLGMAQTQNVRLFCRALLQEGCRVTVLSRWWGTAEWTRRADLPPRGEYDGIRYINACGYLHRPEGWLRRKLLRLRGHIRELKTIWRARRAGELDLVILNTWSSVRLLYYILVSRVLGIPTVMHLVEYYDAYTARLTRKEKLNARILDYASLHLVNGVLPISAFLIERVERMSPGLPWLKDPGLTDVARFDGLHRAPRSKYLLYCGYLGYKEVVLFCMRAFDRAVTGPDVRLCLIVNGSPAEFQMLEAERGKLTKADRIVVRSGVTDRELSQLYMDAYALLIPLRPTDQDRARFPHKIGEYCGSGRPIITTAIGEIAYRFTDGVDAYVARHYDLAEYAAAIEDCLADARKAEAIGAAGRVLAQEVHHYAAFAPRLKRFVVDVIGRHREAAAPKTGPYRLDEDRLAAGDARRDVGAGPRPPAAPIRDGASR